MGGGAGGGGETGDGMSRAGGSGAAWGNKTVGTLRNFERARAMADQKIKQKEEAAKKASQAAAVAGAPLPSALLQKEDQERDATELAPPADRKTKFRDAEVRVLSELRGSRPADDTGSDGSLPGAVPARANKKRVMSIATAAYDGKGILDTDAERRSIEDAIAGKSSYTHHGVHCCVINPTKRFRHTWNTLLTFLLLYIALAVPYRIGFAIELQMFGFGWWADLFVEILFIIDIVLNFVTGIPFDYGYIEMRPDRIRHVYLHGWFAIDLLACIPLRLISAFLVEADGSDNDALKSSKALKILRLLRITRLLQLGKLRYVFMSHADWFEKLEKYARLSGLFLFMGYCCHVFGCFWFWLSTLDMDGDTPNPDSWIVARGIQNETGTVKYITSFYWAITALSTVGFGDISATTKPEMVFSSITVLFGTVIFAVMISYLGNLVSTKNVLSEKTTRQLDELQQFLMQKQLTKQLRNRVRMFLEITYRDEAFDSQAMLDKLPWELQDQVRRQIFKSLLLEMPLFEDISGMTARSTSDHDTINDAVALRNEEYLVELLCNDFKAVNVLIGQTIYQEGELGGEFYCITRGSVVLTSAFGYKRVMEQGDFFGERELFFSRRFEEMGQDDDDGSLPSPVAPSGPVGSGYGTLASSINGVASPNYNGGATQLGGEDDGANPPATQKPNALPIHGRHRHQTATCTSDAELKYIKWPRLLLLKQGGEMGMAIYNRIAEAARQRAAEDTEVLNRRSKRRVVQHMNQVMNKHDDLDVLATKIQANWRGKKTRRAIAAGTYRGSDPLHRVLSVRRHALTRSNSCGLAAGRAGWLATSFLPPPPFFLPAGGGVAMPLHRFTPAPTLVTVGSLFPDIPMAALLLQLQRYRSWNVSSNGLSGLRRAWAPFLRLSALARFIRTLSMPSRKSFVWSRRRRVQRPRPPRRRQPAQKSSWRTLRSERGRKGSRQRRAWVRCHSHGRANKRRKVEAPPASKRRRSSRSLRPQPPQRNPEGGIGEAEPAAANPSRSGRAAAGQRYAQRP
jgi:CRP-like cAMP-binding protein